jgi:hypothetical protein
MIGCQGTSDSTMSADAKGADTIWSLDSARYLTAKVKAPCLGDSHTIFPLLRTPLPHCLSTPRRPLRLSPLSWSALSHRFLTLQYLRRRLHKDVIQPCIHQLPFCNRGGSTIILGFYTHAACESSDRTSK